MTSFLRALLVTIAAALLLAATLPKIDLPWLALPATAGLLWSWRRRDWRQSALLGFVAGMVYFLVAYRWFGETAGALIGPLAPLIVIVPAAFSAWTFALAAVAQWLMRKYVHTWLAPLATACAFAVIESLRNVGVLANPFAEFAYPQASTAIGTLAAFAGTPGVAFAVIFAGALIAEIVAKPTVLRPPAISVGGLLALVIAANIFAPAGHLAAAKTPVALVQGNIRQELKWSPESLDIAVTRYTSLTQSIAAEAPNSGGRPQFIVWPETVITTDLAAAPALQEQFRALASSLDTTLIVGTLERRGDTPYNTLWFIDKTGVERIYRKRRLVPFAEMLPAEKWLSHLPLTNLVSRFGAGTEASVIPIGTLKVAPLICWETEFPELLAAQIARGANVFVAATDDAWFGESDGVYQHAQIAQIRAIESGRYIVRAAATGVSGIIAPNGRFTYRAVVGQPVTLRGFVGEAVATPYNRIGMLPVILLLFAGCALPLVIGLRRRRQTAH